MLPISGVCPIESKDMGQSSQYSCGIAASKTGPYIDRMGQCETYMISNMLMLCATYICIRCSSGS